MVRTIVVGTDGSATASAAVAEAAQLAAGIGATVHLVLASPGDHRAIEAEQGDSHVPEDVRDDVAWVQPAEDVLVQTRDMVLAAGVENVEVHSVHASPAEALIDLAERVSADMIVVGNRGMTGAARFLLGSVPNKVSHHAPCTVMIVKTS